MYGTLALLRRVATRLRLLKAGRRVQAGRDLHLGARTRLWAPLSIRIGEHVYIGKDVHIEANAKIGSHVLIANRVALIGRHDHEIREVGVPVRFGHWVGSRQSPSRYLGEMVSIADDVWIGYGAVVLTGVTIGRGAVVAAGSVVNRDVAPYAIVAGNPAVAVGRRFDDPDVIARHERAIQQGRFESSERGYDHFKISTRDR